MLWIQANNIIITQQVLQNYIFNMLLQRVIIDLTNSPQRVTSAEPIEQQEAAPVEESPPRIQASTTQEGPYDGVRIPPAHLLQNRYRKKK